MIIAKKPCNVGGKKYLTGETIPSEAILPARTKQLADIGLIEVRPDASKQKPKVDKPKKADTAPKEAHEAEKPKDA